MGLLNGPFPGSIQDSVISPVERQVEEIEAEGDSCSETREALTQSTTESLQLCESRSLSPADGSGGCAISIKEEIYTSFTTIQPLGTRRCGQDCQCRCHGHQLEDVRYSLMSTVFGSWHVRNQAVDRTCERQCGPSMGSEFEYHPPRWLWAGVAPLGGYRGGQPTLTYSLRAPRIIPFNETVWYWIDRPSVLRHHLSEGLALFPDDTTEYGSDLITVGSWKRLNMENSADLEFCREPLMIKHVRVLRFCLSCGKMCSHDKGFQGCIMQKPDCRLG